MPNPPILTDIISKGKIKEHKALLITPGKTTRRSDKQEDNNPQTEITNTEQTQKPAYLKLNEQINQLIEQKLDAFKTELTTEIQNILQKHDF